MDTAPAGADAARVASAVARSTTCTWAMSTTAGTRAFAARSAPTAGADAGDASAGFHFADASQRGPFRLDLRLGGALEAPPFDLPLDAIWPQARAALGEGQQLEARMADNAQAVARATEDFLSRHHQSVELLATNLSDGNWDGRRVQNLLDRHMAAFDGLLTMKVEGSLSCFCVAFAGTYAYALVDKLIGALPDTPGPARHAKRIQAEAKRKRRNDDVAEILSGARAGKAGPGRARRHPYRSRAATGRRRPPCRS